jgi:signal transduction histidine kinase
LIKKIYVKLVLIFISVFLLGNAASYLIASFGMEKSMVGELSNLMIGVVTDAKYVYEKGGMPVEDIEKVNSSGLISVRFYEKPDELMKAYNIPDGVFAVTADKPVVIEVKSKSSYKFKIPMAFVKSGNFYIVAVPEAKNLLLNLRALIFRVNILSIIFGSVLMLIASRFIVKPVKKLSEATEKIAKGDFDIILEKKSNDELGQLIENFNMMTKELSSMEMLRNDFVSNISHEFKTPLTSIEGYAKLLRDCESSEERNEYVEIITEETRRLSALSSSILLLNRIENENIILVRNPFRLDEQIRHVILFHESKWSSKEINLQLDMDELVYEGNEQLLYQVWLNLLDNAVKFSKPGGAIEINLRKSDGKVVFTITDYGKGMTVDIKKRMFEKFYTGDKSRNTEGNGLGLSIVKRIIDMHGGKIDVTSSLDEFTSIKVKL